MHILFTFVTRFVKKIADFESLQPDLTFDLPLFIIDLIKENPT